ncbi:MAG: hypothetical protein LKJ80_00935 [Oscillibacter sp.]|jgi:hypothetical protein|nr:hypothetical protein [Oscillibacter sp.]
MGSPQDSKSEHPDKACGEVSILAFQIYDQCRQKWCDSAGPWVSAEPCECILLEMPGESDQYGRYLAPGQPVTLPDRVKKVKAEADSFVIQRLGASVLRPVDPSRDCWEVEVRAAFACNVEFYSEAMQRFPIRLLCESEGEKTPVAVRPSLHTAFTVEKRIILHGGRNGVTAAGLPEERGWGSAPHAFVELKADPLEFRSVRAEDSGACDEVCDCNYEEPLNYLYGTVGAAMMLFLYRIVSLRIPSSGIAIPKDCLCGLQTPCEQFLQMNFPPELKA